MKYSDRPVRPRPPRPPGSAPAAPSRASRRRKGTSRGRGRRSARVSSAVSRSRWTRAERRRSFSDIVASVVPQLPEAVFRRAPPAGTSPSAGPGASPGRPAAPPRPPPAVRISRSRRSPSSVAPAATARAIRGAISAAASRSRASGLEAQPLEEVVIEGELEDPLVEPGIREHVRAEQHRRAGDLPAQLEGSHLRRGAPRSGATSPGPPSPGTPPGSGRAARTARRPSSSPRARRSAYAV